MGPGEIRSNIGITDGRLSRGGSVKSTPTSPACADLGPARGEHVVIAGHSYPGSLAGALDGPGNHNDKPPAPELADEAAKQKTRNHRNPDCLQRVGRNVTARIRNQLLLRGV